jgi:hypothetical protein
MKFFATCLFLFFTFNIFALPSAEVVKIRGDVFHDGVKLSKGDLISKSGLLTTKRSSFVKIFIKDWNSSIILGPKGEMKIDLSSKQVKKKYSFLKGSCRWITSKGKKAKGVVYTNNASLGVRGTDYILKVTALLGESEIVVIDGKVEFKNAQNPDDFAVVGKGQWGGLGGRYGQTIGEILDLPPNVVAAFDRQLKL